MIRGSVVAFSQQSKIRWAYMSGKVLAIIVTPPSFKASGGVTAGLELSRALVRLSPYDIAIMSSEDKIEEEPEGVYINRFRCESRFGKLGALFPRSLQTTFLNPRSIADFILKTKPRLVHFHNPHPANALWELAKVCIGSGIPYVMSSHGFVETSNPKSWLGTNVVKLAVYNLLVRKPFKKTVENAAAILLTSPPEHKIADELGVSRSKRFIVTNGYDLFFRKKAETTDLKLVQERFDINSECPTFLFLGNHTSNKGIDTLLEACHKAQSDWRVVIGGAIRSQEEHALLCKKYRVNDIKSRVVFSDFLSRKELRALYQSVDGFVFPSKADTLPLVILDAMASELPVISTTVGGIPYQVDETTGRLVRPDDSDELSVILDELAVSPDLRKRLGSAGLRRVQKRFNWDVSARSALVIYDQILKTEAP